MMRRNAIARNVTAAAAAAAAAARGRGEREESVAACN
jgi:hypothetical protein